MRQFLELTADEPIDRLSALGIAAIVHSEEEEWSVGPDPLACRTLATRLLELAATHERQHQEGASC
jgi:hypothetical protein